MKKLTTVHQLNIPTYLDCKSNIVISFRNDFFINFYTVVCKNTAIGNKFKD